MPEVKPKNRRSKSTDYRSSVVVSPYTSLSSFPSLQGSICEINKLDGHARKYSISWLPLATWVTSSTLYLQLLLLVIGGLAGLMHVVLSSWVSISQNSVPCVVSASSIFLANEEDEDEDEEENSSQQPLLESSKNKPGSMNTDSFWSCCSFRGIHVGGRQKFVITVVVLIFFLMLSFAVIIWIGVGKNPICSSVAARVYVDFFASAILILGGALGCYGLLLFLKLRNVRSETASSEMRKVAGLAVVSVVCFTSSAAVALLTDVPVLPPPCLCLLFSIPKDKDCLFDTVNFDMLCYYAFALKLEFTYVMNLSQMEESLTVGEGGPAWDIHMHHYDITLLGVG
ncbi:hypothetical protein D5086_004535 [Populus alba]|uniref:Uncharacterized protein n=1 Tax=Populus alba TaxID=43335 RepID=A0ACC4CQP1_POPAL